METLEESDEQIPLQDAIASLIDPVDLDSVIKCAVPLSEAEDLVHPRTALLYVRFLEDVPQVDMMARFLWGKCTNYALSRRRRIELHKRMMEAKLGDLSNANLIVEATKEVFLNFNKEYPSRASEVGEVLAYCIAISHLQAPQLASKMSLKTSSNMPVHGLDGIHGTFNSNGMFIYFLESKLSASANEGVKEFAESCAGFGSDRKQYLREYELVADLGNLDTLTGEARKKALEYFDVMSISPPNRRERSVGVICYSEKKNYNKKVPVSDKQPVTIHEEHFLANYISEFSHHQGAASKHLANFQIDPHKCIVFFVAVPDVNGLREKFYQFIGAEVGVKPTKAKSSNQKSKNSKTTKSPTSSRKRML